MPIVKISLNEAYYKKLKEMAEEDGISIQDCIRNRLFGETTDFTPADAVERALKKYGAGDLFTLPELYDKEWTIPRGPAGVFGKQFFHNVVDRCSGKIEFVGMTNYGRHAQYKVVGK